jgi:hypothetical protein
MAAVDRLEEMRRRIRESVERIRARGVLGGGILGQTKAAGATPTRLLRGQVKGPLALGGGQLIRTAEETLNKITTRLMEMRPNIIPTALERVKKFEPGKRISEIIPKEAGAPKPAEVGEVKEKSKLLRR